MKVPYGEAIETIYRPFGNADRSSSVLLSITFTDLICSPSALLIIRFEPVNFSFIRTEQIPLEGLGNTEIDFAIIDSLFLFFKIILELIHNN